jgi:sRNA-binding protein
MSSIRKLERNRGLKESREQIKVLQDKWPAGFPKQASLVRPLANGTAKTIAEAFGWSVAYTRAVLMVWKSCAAYCTAVLAHPKRINLDGSTSDEEVDDKARLLATERLAVLASHHERRNKPRRPLPGPSPAADVIRISCEYGTFASSIAANSPR